jgi:CRP/FNR family transcriptional regulator, cyclic AMP receptor protein
MGVSSHEFLNDIPLFKGIPQEQMIDILRMLRPVEFKAGELIFRQGDEGRAAFVVQSGAVEIFLQADQNAIVVARFKSGEIFGELALIDGSPRSAGARAITRCEILCLDKQEFDFLRAQHQPVAFHLLRRFSDELCARIRDTNTQIDQLLVHGKSDQRGGPIVTSARVAPKENPSANIFKRWISKFSK